MVAAKKQEILSKNCIEKLETQPQLNKIKDILAAGIQNHISETSASLLLAEKEYN